MFSKHLYSNFYVIFTIKYWIYLYNCTYVCICIFSVPLFEPLNVQSAYAASHKQSHTHTHTLTHVRTPCYWHFKIEYFLYKSVASFQDQHTHTFTHTQLHFLLLKMHFHLIFPKTKSSVHLLNFPRVFFTIKSIYNKFPSLPLALIFPTSFSLLPLLSLSIYFRLYISVFLSLFLRLFHSFWA